MSMIPTTLVEVYADEMAVITGQPKATVIYPNAPDFVVEVVTHSEAQQTDPETGKPYAVMASAGRNIYVQSSPPASGQYVGDLWFPFPTP